MHAVSQVSICWHFLLSDFTLDQCQQVHTQQQVHHISKVLNVNWQLSQLRICNVEWQHKPLDLLL